MTCEICGKITISINSSHGIIYAVKRTDFAAKAMEEALSMRQELKLILENKLKSI